MSSPSRTGIGVLCSGRGSNLQALLDAGTRGELGPAAVRVVIANVPGAHALARAQQAGVPALLRDHKDYPDRATFDAELVRVLQEHEVQIVALAGFMRLLSPEFLQAFPDRVLNVHPALLPAFPGLHAVRQALEYGVRYTGCTVHLVDQGCDTGPVVLQAVVPVLHGDDEDRLAARILHEEHRLYPQAVRVLAEGRVQRHGRKTLVVPHPGQAR